ncbi:hypothetical protein JIQ42_01628 [Leishmania sp. Namibia]|uniref:hypothetical protein n=1 Tax=Leishmania sp. Namibia TaxID=2802991 RepID=UPI001B654A12|nr:hypothetical protein JIQ42_01628 [Leishmania sp. Namibia]
MFHRSCTWLFFNRIFKVSKPPMSGYEIAELPNEKVLHEFMQFYRSKGVVVILHSGASYAVSAAASSGGSCSSRASALVGPSAKTCAATTAASASASKPKTDLLQDPLTRSFISSINAMNLGNPEEVKLALVPGPLAPSFVKGFNVITYPTSLLFLNGQCVYRVVGARTRELSIKSLFMLRNGGRNIFSRE